MSAAARARLAARVAGDYAAGGHRAAFVPDLNDVAAVGNEVAGSVVAADVAQAAAESAAAQALASSNPAANLAGRRILYRDATQFRTVTRDAAGRANQWAENDGRSWFTGLGLSLAMRRDSAMLRAVVEDRGGRSSLAYDPVDGMLTLAVRHLRAEALPADRDWSPGVWGILDRDGHVALGVQQDGTITLRVTPVALAWLRSDLWLPPSTLRGGLRGHSVGMAAEYLMSAVVQEADKFASEVVQRTDRASTTALVMATAPLRYIPWYGQSNAAGGTAYNTTLTAARYRHHAMTMNAARLDGGSAATSVSFSILNPLYNPTGELYGATAMGIALEAWGRDAGATSDGRVFFSHRKGSTAIDGFLSGTVPYDNLIQSAADFATLARLYGRRPEIPALHWVQGENGSVGYQADLTALVADMKADLRAATGQAFNPVIMVTQTNNSDTSSSYSEVALAQLAVARSVAGVVMPGPMYPYPLLADGLHPNEIGKRMFGEVTALCYQRVEAGLSWNPLWPTGVTRSGATIDITFALPPGGGALDWDEDWILAAADYGFVYTDDGTPPAISSVTITGSNTLRIVLASTPTGANKRILYAMGQDTTDDGWSGARGQLFSPSTQATTAELTGIAGGPSLVRHYCVRFEETVP